MAKSHLDRDSDDVDGLWPGKRGVNGKQQISDFLCTRQTCQMQRLLILYMGRNLQEVSQTGKWIV